MAVEIANRWFTDAGGVPIMAGEDWDMPAPPYPPWHNNNKFQSGFPSAPKGSGGDEGRVRAPVSLILDAEASKAAKRDYAIMAAGMQKYGDFQFSGPDAFARKKAAVQQAQHNNIARTQANLKHQRARVLAAERRQYDIAVERRGENPERIAYPDVAAELNERDPNALSSGSWMVDPGVGPPVAGYESTGKGVTNLELQAASNAAYVSRRDQGFVPPKGVSGLDVKASAHAVVKAIRESQVHTMYHHTVPAGENTQGVINPKPSEYTRVRDHGGGVQQKWDSLVNHTKNILPSHPPGYYIGRVMNMRPDQETRSGAVGPSWHSVTDFANNAYSWSKKAWMPGPDYADKRGRLGEL